MNHSDSVNKDFLGNIAEFSEKLLTVEDFSILAERTIEYIQRILNPVYVNFLLFEGGSYRILLDKFNGQVLKRTINPELEECDNITLAMAKGGQVMPNRKSKTLQFLALYDHDQAGHCEFCIPFFISDKYIGIISLGKSSTDSEYSIEAIEFLHVLTNTVALVCNNISAADGQTKGIGVNDTQSGGGPEQKPHTQARVGAGWFNNYSEILGDSPEIRKIREIINQVAAQEVSVLITGESGTGKELVAQAIHRQSQRAARPLVAMNCAAMPENLVESELFGHEKGAFTGAFSQKKGKFEYANLSSLFLDEIGDMNLSTQAKLLRILQDGQFQRVGGNKSLFADVRLVAATNKNLLREIEKGNFRQDLYYRINVVQIEMPPLRNRGDDIVLLAEYFLNYYCQRYNKEINGIESDVLEWMRNYDFPGNIRELKNIIERSVIMGKKSNLSMDTITGVDLVNLNVAAANPTISLEELEKKHILSVMKQVGNNKSAAARILGIARKTLREKLQKYGITI